MQTLVQMENLLYTLKAYNVVQYQRSLLARRGIETTWQNHPSMSLRISRGRTWFFFGQLVLVYMGPYDDALLVL